MDAERLQQIEKLYHAVRERAVEERESLLGQADPELRREVESLLKRDGIEGPWDRSAFRLLRNSNMARIAVGTQIGPYRIEALLGVGGMGEVYRARNLRLKQEVALKVLPAIWARDPERTARFQREAEILASLNHPNIAAIHGLEASDGMQALVMELVEGESPKGPLGFDEAWPVASQVAAALEYAHDRGIVHRDLKPANIKITGDGLVKLLDFGLAKAFMAQRDGSAGAANPEDSPTLTIGATEAGMILGTAAYMSPEQARGKPVDKRADIWAFGVVFYELLTGERLFQGEDTAEILAAVIHKQPDLSRVPVKARRLLERCLEKDPKKRLRDIGEASAWLEASSSVAPSPGPSRSVAWVIAAALGVVAAAALSWIAYRAARQTELKPLVRLDVDLGHDAVTADGTRSIAISPDGKRIVYAVRTPDGKSSLVTRLLDQPNAVPLAGTENGVNPFFSPDGQWIGFFANNNMKKVSIQGGASVTLWTYTTAHTGGSWGDDGSIVAARAGGPLYKVPAAGGMPQALTQLKPDELTHRWPQVLPGGNNVLFTASSSSFVFDGATVRALSVKTGEITTLVRNGYFGKYVPVSDSAGYLLYVSQGVLFAVPFDPVRLALRGTPTPVVDGIEVNRAPGGVPFVFSDSGTLIYHRNTESGQVSPIVWLDDSGRIEPLLAKPDFYREPTFSPDGKRLKINLGDIFVYDWQRDVLSRLTFSGRVHYNPVWTPDGKYLVYGSPNPPNALQLELIRADGGGEAQRLFGGKTLVIPYSFSPDGRRLAYTEIEPAGNSFDIWTLPLDWSDPEHPKAGKPELFLGTPAIEFHAAFSPDGHWIAYASDEAGNFEVFVRPFPGPGGQWQISTGGGRYPIWSRNGRELFYETLDNHVMVADYTAKNDSFVPGKPRLWSKVRLTNAGGLRSFDVAPDGKRIAAALPLRESKPEDEASVTFLLNFLDELKRKAPPK